MESKKTHYNYKNGKIDSECYLKGGKLHRENGPAQILYYENGNVKREYYYKDFKLHNENGPAIICYDENGNIESEECYINNKLILNNKEIKNYINTNKPIRIKNIVKLKLLCEIFKQRGLKDKEEEIEGKLLLETLLKN